MVALSRAPPALPASLLMPVRDHFTQPASCGINCMPSYHRLLLGIEEEAGGTTSPAADNGEPACYHHQPHSMQLYTGVTPPATCHIRCHSAFLPVYVCGLYTAVVRLLPLVCFIFRRSYALLGPYFSDTAFSRQISAAFFLLYNAPSRHLLSLLTAA